jgi:hypothetical protein
MRRYVLGELRMLDDRGGIHTRKMQGANCDEVVQALSLAAAVALDPSVLLSDPVPWRLSRRLRPRIPHRQSLPPRRSSVDVQRTTDAPPSLASPSDRRFELGAAAVGSIFLSSGISPGMSVFGRWTPAGSGRFRPTVGMAVTYVRNDVLRSPGAAQASLTGLVVTMCGTGWGASVMKVKPCGLVMAGLLSVSGLQVARTKLGRSSLAQCRRSRANGGPSRARLLARARSRSQRSLPQAGILYDAAEPRGGEDPNHFARWPVSDLPMASRSKLSEPHPSPRSPCSNQDLLVTSPRWQVIRNRA